MTEPNFYKIVQTIENGKSLLSPVPRLWENKGKLMWPPKNKKDAAMKCPLMRPGTVKDGWTEYNCILKRSFIPTYSPALLEIRTMSDRSDTSEAEVMLPKPSKKRSAAVRKYKNPDEDRFNYNQLVQSINSKTLKCEQVMLEPGQNQQEICQEQQQQEQHQQELRHQEQQLEELGQQEQQQQEIQQQEQSWQFSVGQIQTPQQWDFQAIENQQQEQNQVVEEQRIVVGSDGELHLYPATTDDENIQSSTALNSGVLVSIVECIARLEKRVEFLILQQERYFGQQPITAEKKAINFELDSFKHIDTIEELIIFEKKLENKEFINELCPKLYCVCGPTTGLVGDNVSYKLVDALFSHRLFTLVSWSGNSRVKKNESFSRFTATFKFFFHLVQRCDASYTEANLKKFFLKIINNSKRRYEVSQNLVKRMSSVRHFGNVPKRRKVPDSNEVPTATAPMSNEANNQGESSLNTSSSNEE